MTDRPTEEEATGDHGAHGDDSAVLVAGDGDGVASGDLLMGDSRPKER